MRERLIYGEPQSSMTWKAGGPWGGGGGGGGGEKSALQNMPPLQYTPPPIALFLYPPLTADMDDPAVNSQLAGFANTFRVSGSTIILYTYCKCLLQTFATMVYHPPSANPAVDSKLLDVVIHLAASVGKLIKTEPIIHKYMQWRIQGGGV